METQAPERFHRPIFADDSCDTNYQLATVDLRPVYLALSLLAVHRIDNGFFTRP